MALCKEKHAEVLKREEDINTLHSKGLSNKEISKTLNIPYNYVAHLVRQYGLEPNYSINIRTVIISEDGRIKCNKCLQTKDKNEFPTRLTKRNKILYSGSCKECKYRYSYKYTYESGSGIFNKRVNDIKARCIKKNIPCDITASYIKSLYELQNGKCVYTGETIALTLVRPLPDGVTKDWNILSVDRIVPEKGYIQGNVVLCILKANTIKSDLSLSQLKKWLPSWYENVTKFLSKI